MSENTNKRTFPPKPGEGITWWEYPEPEDPEETILYGPYGTLVAQVRLRKQSRHEAEFVAQRGRKKWWRLLQWWLGS